MRKYISTLLLLVCTSVMFAQGVRVEFGKNRVQYHDDFKEWSEYESPNFITYWYGKSRNVGQSAVQIAELDHNAIQNILDHRINNKIELIVYADITDLKQSNIGTEDAFVNTAGQTKIVGNKVFVYFNGDHQHLRQQIREGIASVYLNSMLFGSNLQEIVQNAVMMNLPNWFEKGLVAYVGSEWNARMDNRLKDAMLHEDYENFEQLAEEQPQLAGHALWYFIGQNYGKSTVSNLLYLTRINRSIESGFLYVLGSNYERILVSWETFFKSKYEIDEQGRNPLDENYFKVKNRRNLPLSQVKMSPDGSKIAYVSNEIGKYKVYLHDLISDERKVIHKGGFRNAFQATDYNYPLLAWKPSGYELSIIYERRDVIKWINYDVKTDDIMEEIVDPQYQRIINAEYIDNSKMIFSAIVNGYSDLFIYETLNRQTQRISNDFYDDVDATVVRLENKKGILFASNRAEPIFEPARLDSILPIQKFDIFYYDLSTRSPELIRVTDTPLADERNPVAIDTTWFGYLTDESGIYNRKVGYIEDVFLYNEKTITFKDKTEIIIPEDSIIVDLDTSLVASITLDSIFEKQAFTHHNSDYSRSILEWSIGLKTNKMVELVRHEDEHQIFVQNVAVDTIKEVRNTVFQDQQISIYNSINGIVPVITNNTNEQSVLAEISDPIEITEPEEKPDDEKVDIDNYLFQSEFDDEETPSTVEVEEGKGTIVLEQPDDPINIATPKVKQPDVHKFRSSNIIPYRIKFRTDFVTTNVDNSLLFGGLDTYAGDREEFSTPPPGILFKANFKDLFEDYQIEGGIRLPTTFNGAEYFLLFDDKKGRFDKRYAAYRKVTRTRFDFQPQDTERREFVTLLANAEIRYPFDIFRSLRLSGTLRNDRTSVLATSKASLAEPSFNEQRVGAKLEFVFDNTLDVSVNIKNGTRYKVYAEVVKRFRLDLLKNENRLEFDPGVMTVLGVDARHYQRLDKRSILAARFAAATSFGSEKILYFLGGTDGWLFPDFNSDVPLPLNDEFAYQTLAANMRGFSQNSRNGNSFMLSNIELRVPLFQYFTKKTIRNPFLRNFQIMGFFDIGTAWQGITPFSEDNPLNIDFLIGEEANPVSVQVVYFRDPIVMGYGAGVRSSVFGYFVRLDYAWGIESRIVQDPRFFLSIGTDF